MSVRSYEVTSNADPTDPSLPSLFPSKGFFHRPGRVACARQSRSGFHSDRPRRILGGVNTETIETCVTCGEPVSTPFCPSCGEKRASDRSYSLWEFIKDHVIESVMNFDGRVIRTMKVLVTKPGELTAAFMRGSRLPFLQPLQCFLLLNLAFFLWASAMHVRIFDTQLAVHLRGMPYTTKAKALVKGKLAETHEDIQVYAKRFDTVGTAQARSLVITMVPVFAAVIGVVTVGRKRRPVVQHVVFALHFFAFFFILLIFAAYAIDLPLNFILRTMHYPEGVFGYDGPDSVAAGIVLAVYLGLALRTAYGLGRTRAMVTAAVGVPLLWTIITYYRGLLFFITFYST